MNLLSNKQLIIEDFLIQRLSINTETSKTLSLNNNPNIFDYHFWLRDNNLIVSTRNIIEVKSAFGVNSTGLNTAQPNPHIELQVLFW